VIYDNDGGTLTALANQLPGYYVPEGNGLVEARMPNITLARPPSLVRAANPSSQNRPSPL